MYFLTPKELVLQLKMAMKAITILYIITLHMLREKMAQSSRMAPSVEKEMRGATGGVMEVVVGINSAIMLRLMPVSMDSFCMVGESYYQEDCHFFVEPTFIHQESTKRSPIWGPRSSVNFAITRRTAHFLGLPCTTPTVPTTPLMTSKDGMRRGQKWP